MSALSLLAVALACPAFAGRRVAPPPADVLIKRASGAPTAHEGVFFVESFGEKPSARRVRVSFAPPAKWRREVLDDNGATVLLAVSDGRTDWLYDAASKRVWTGETAGRGYAQFGREDAADLIAENYSAKVSTGEPVAGRSTWALDLRARGDGTLQRRLWLDRRGGLVLRGQSYHEGRLVSDYRFESVRYIRPKSTGFRFVPPDGARVVKRSAARDMPPARAKEASGSEPRAPRWLPVGYIYGSVDVLKRGDKDILHSRFSDGINALSLFQCPKGVKLDFGAKKSERVTLAMGDGELALASEGRVLAWEAGGERFMLVGRLSGEALKRVAESVR